MHRGLGETRGAPTKWHHELPVTVIVRALSVQRKRGEEEEEDEDEGRGRKEESQQACDTNLPCHVSAPRQHKTLFVRRMPLGKLRGRSYRRAQTATLINQRNMRQERGGKEQKKEREEGGGEVVDEMGESSTGIVRRKIMITTPSIPRKASACHQFHTMC